MSPRYQEFRLDSHHSIHELTDTSNECKHGCLPFDRNKPSACQCWNLTWKPKVAKPAPAPERTPRVALVGRLRSRPIRPRPHPHPADAKRRALSLYVEGATARETAARTGVSHSTVLRWVRAAGVVRRTGPQRRAAA